MTFNSNQIIVFSLRPLLVDPDRDLELLQSFDIHLSSKQKIGSFASNHLLKIGAVRGLDANLAAL